MVKPEKFIPVARPWMDEREAEAAKRPILSGWVTQGPEVKAFEEEFATIMGSQYACAVSNCTNALHLALKAVGVSEGDEVITLSHSFIATANAVRYCGGIPVFVDIEADTYNINPDLIEPAISDRTKAILCVHQMGMPCDLRRIIDIADKYSIPVVEDAACAIGSEIYWNGNWEKIGKPHGEIACFSFHPRKLITTGDGGMLTTNNTEYNKKFRLWRQHSMSVPDAVRHSSNQVIFEEYTELGYNYRMTDIQAAIGRVQLTRLTEIIKRRREQADIYRHLLKDIKGLILPSEPDWARSNWQSFCVRLPDGCDQKVVMQKMLNKGISTRRGIMCTHREPAYADPSTWRCTGTPEGESGRDLLLQHSEQATDTGIILPLYHTITDNEFRHIVETIENVLSGVDHERIL